MVAKMANFAIFTRYSPRPHPEAAANKPTAGRPTYHILFLMAEPPRRPRNPIPRPTFKGAAPNHVSVRKDQVPASTALVASGASRVDHREFRMLRVGGHLETPLATLPFEVWRINNRLAQHDGRNGVRQGPNTKCPLAASAQTPPPGVRLAGVREIVGVLPLPG